MKSLKGTQTQRNLMAAFAGESQARNRYTFFASKAKEEGYIQIALVFEETAQQEKEHAKRLFKFMDGDVQEIKESFPFGVIGTTEKNLQASAAGETHEYTSMYPSFAETAQAEGFGELAVVFKAIAVAEQQHAKRFEKLRANIIGGKVFKAEQKVVWRCLNCGYLFEGTEPPKTCPACAHPQAYFELLGENY